MTCSYCDDTGVEPCENCGERDCGRGNDLPCVIDGCVYGAGPCRQNCPGWDDIDPLPALSEMFTALEAMTLDSLTEGTLADLGMRYDLILRIQGILRTQKEAVETALIEAMPENTVTTGGVRIHRERAARSAWKPDGSARMRADIEHLVATKLATDVMTGEVDQMRRNMISFAIHELWEVLPAPSAMKAGAKKYGLRIGEYREFTDGWNLSVVPLEEGI